MNDNLRKVYDRAFWAYQYFWGGKKSGFINYGYWNESIKSPSNAHFLLFEKICEQIDFSKINTVLDLGCGFGAASRLLGEKYGLEVHGVTHSAKQHQLCIEQNNNSKVKFYCQDYHDFLTETNHKFDLIWCLESTYHEVNRSTFFEKLKGKLTAHGQIVLLDYYADESLFVHNKFQFWKRGYHIGAISTEDQFQIQLINAGLKEYLSLDWSKNVLPGSRRIGFLGKLGILPMSVLKNIGLVSADFLEGIRGSAAQYDLLKEGKWYYKMKILKNI